MTMNERVARAFHSNVSPGMAQTASLDWDELPDVVRADFRVAAQKLIAAMRLPTDDMLAEGDRRDLPKDAANMWERMIFRAMYGPRE